MELQTKQTTAWSKAGVAIVCGLWLAVGCDMGMEQSSNRYEQLNIETTKLLDVLKQVSDEASAKEHQAELEEAGENIRDIQEKITAAAEKTAKKGGGGLGRITNNRQAKMFQQSGDSARRQVDRIREADAKAGAIVDKALEGVEFPQPELASPIGL